MQLEQLETQLTEQYEQLSAQNLSLDLTRGKPSPDQLSLSDAMNSALPSTSIDGVDLRNYGGLDGLPPLKELFTKVLKCPSEQVLIGGNSSLTLMYQTLMFANFLGLFEGHQPWSKQDFDSIKFLCPVPGYDRHFSICESFGIEMININMNENGPDMDQVEQLVKADSSIKGIWNVPRFSNPTGLTYSDETVDRIAALPKLASDDFIVMWDNAYALHQLEDSAQALASISDACEKHGTNNQVFQFASTSKITYAGSGVAALATGTDSLAAFKTHLGMSTIGPDKINQARHLELFNNFEQLTTHMAKHAEVLKPRFDMVLEALDKAFADQSEIQFGSWTKPKGGYFISFDTQPGLATQIIDLCAKAGVKMTPAGATFPYKKDPEDKNIRIAPSFASLEDINKAMEIFIVCVKLATVKKLTQ